MNKERRWRMAAHDLTAALNFLRYEVETTPQQLLAEVEAAMDCTDPGGTLWHTLLTVADFLERI